MKCCRLDEGFSKIFPSLGSVACSFAKRGKQCAAGISMRVKSAAKKNWNDRGLNVVRRFKGLDRDEIVRRWKNSPIKS